MSPKDLEQPSLFSPTSAFVQDEHQRTEPVAPPPPTPAPKSDALKLVGELVGDVLFMIDDRPDNRTPFVEEIERALEEIEQEIGKHA